MPDKIVNHFVLADGSVARYSAESLVGTIPEIDTVIDSANILDTSNHYTGAIGSDGSLMTNGVYANYYTSDFVELEPNTDYYFSAYTQAGIAGTNRKLLLLFDSDKNALPATHQNADAVAQLTFNTSETAKYVRVSCGTAAFQYGQIAMGTTAGAYSPYSEKKELNINLGETPSAQVIEIVNNSGIVTYEVGKNLVNPSTLEVGAVQSNGTIATNGSWGSYYTSDYTEIEQNTDYVFDIWNADTTLGRNRMAMLLFDENKNIISNTYTNTDAVSYLPFNSGNAHYIRCSSKNNLYLQVEKGTLPTSYELYSGKNVVSYPLGVVPMAQTQISNVLYQKKWAVCGDSFTNGATDNRLSTGKYAGRRIVYPYIIGNKNDMEILRFFDGGRTLAFPAVPNTFTNSLTNPNASWYYQNIPVDADYITIYLGINDEHHAPNSSGGDGEDNTGVIPIGTISDTTTSTYYGAWNVVLTWLITNRPNAHIGIIITNGIESKNEYRQAQLAIASKYGIPYIDLNGDSRTPAMLRTSNPDIDTTVKQALIQKWAVDPSTNTHPNDDAHEFESTFIENFLRTI